MSGSYVDEEDLADSAVIGNVKTGGSGVEEGDLPPEEHQSTPTSDSAAANLVIPRISSLIHTPG